MLLNQSANIPEHAICCGQVFQRGEEIQKSTNVLKIYIYYWILHNPQDVQSPIENDFLKVFIGGHSEKQMAIKKFITHVCPRTT